jgi:hypothetical protein
MTDYVSLQDAIDVFKGMGPGDISAFLSARGIDIISVCEGPRTENCPFALYFTQRTGRAVKVILTSAYFTDVEEALSFEHNPVLPLTRNIMSWIYDYDKRDKEKWRLAMQHRQVNLTPNALLSLG